MAYEGGGSLYDVWLKAYLLNDGKFNAIEFAWWNVAYPKFDVSKNWIAAYVPNQGKADGLVHIYDMNASREIWTVTLEGSEDLTYAGIKFDNAWKYFAINEFVNSKPTFAIYDWKNHRVVSRWNGACKFFSEDGDSVFVSGKNKDFIRMDFLENRTVDRFEIPSDLNYLSIESTSGRSAEIIVDMFSFWEKLIFDLQTKDTVEIRTYWRLINIDWIDMEGKLLISNEEFKTIRIARKSDFGNGIVIAEMPRSREDGQFTNLIVGKKYQSVLLEVEEWESTVLVEIQITKIIEKCEFR